MTKKADFNAEEWPTLAEAPLLAGMRVAAAGRGGTLRESLALGRTFAQARQQHGDSELLDELVSSPPSIDPDSLRELGDIGSASSQRLRTAVQLLEQKGTPEDVEAYRGFVLSLAEAAASAHQEGGFLGVGGQEVSDEERQALDEIRSTLGG